MKQNIPVGTEQKYRITVTEVTISPDVKTTVTMLDSGLYKKFTKAQKTPAMPAIFCKKYKEFCFWLRLRIFVLTHITFKHLFKNSEPMANQLAERIRTLTNSKIDFVHDEAEEKLKAIVDGALTLDELADEFTKLAGEDVDQQEIAEALVDLADIFDDNEMTPEKNAQLDSVVTRLLKTGTPEQKEAAKNLFTGVLGYGLAAKATNDYFDTLLDEGAANGGE